MTRNRTFVCWLATLSAFVLVGCSAIGPLSKSDDKICASILKRTPVGCSSDSVFAFIKQERWSIHAESKHEGFTKIVPGLGRAQSPVVGSSFVACELGTTHFVMFPFETVKYAYWGFDTSGHLVDVWIDEDTDAL